MDKIHKRGKNGKIILIIFCIVMTFWAAFAIPGYFGAFSSWGIDSLTTNPKIWGVMTLIAVTILLILFWTGLIMFFTANPKTDLKTVAVCAITGMIPIVDIFTIHKFFRAANNLMTLESDEQAENKAG